jgi:hypothetical protein
MEEIGRTRPTTVAELMEEANRFADGEDAYNNKRGRSPEADRTSRQRRRHCSRDNQGRQNQVATGYEPKEEKVMKIGSSKQKEQKNRDTPALQPKTCYMDLIESTTRISMERESQTTR